jgi:Tol biopolymer transport system component
MGRWKLGVLALWVVACGPVHDTGGGGDTQPVGFVRGIALVQRGDIWIADQSDFEQKIQRLTSDGSNTEPALSADGKQVAYVHIDGASGAAGIFKVSTHGGVPTELVASGAHSYSGLCWSPDGSRLYLGVDHAIAQLNADGSGQQTLSPAGADVHDPSVSSDGTVYAIDFTASQVVRLAGGSATPVISSIQAGRATISPSGTEVAYDDSTSHEIFVVDLATQTPRQVTRINAGQQREAAWSRDGLTLFFTSNAGGADKIYRIDANASSASGTLVQVGSEPSFGG